MYLHLKQFKFYFVFLQSIPQDETQSALPVVSQIDFKNFLKISAILIIDKEQIY